MTMAIVRPIAPGSSPLDRVVVALHGAVELKEGRRGPYRVATCPACHVDGALFIHEQADGSVRLICEKHCSTKGAVLPALGLTPAQLKAARTRREPGDDAPNAGRPERFGLLSDLELEQLPPLRFLVESVLPVDCKALLYGAPEAGKSFVAIDLACSIATGEPWLGHDVLQRGPVVYVAAEGSAGLRARLIAWKCAHGYEGKSIPLYFLTETANLMQSGDAGALLAAIRARCEANPALIVFDTLHRSMPGGDDNSARDLGIVFENADIVRRATGAVVLFVHHPTKDGESERGSGSLRAGVDTMLQLKVQDDRRTLICEKQKDGAKFPPIELRLALTAFGSCIVQLARLTGDEAGSITPHQLASLTALSEIALKDGATTSEWQTAAEDAKVPRASFFRTRKWLLANGYVSQREKGTGKRYSLTPSGTHALGIRSHDSLNGVSPPGPSQVSVSSHRPPPFRGVSETDTDGATGTEIALFDSRPEV